MQELAKFWIALTTILATELKRSFSVNKCIVMRKNSVHFIEN